MASTANPGLSQVDDAADAAATSYAQRILAQEQRFEFVSGTVAWPLAVAAFGLVHVAFASLAPAERLWPWTAGMAVATGLWLAVNLAVLWRRPSDEALVRLWAPLAKAVMLMVILGVAATVWLFFPYATDDGMRLVMVIFYVAFVGIQAAGTTEALGLVLTSVVAIVGSVALYFAQRDAFAFSALLVVFGLVMIAISLSLRRSYRAALTAHAASERLARRLDAALQSARTERDAKTRFIASASHDLRQPLVAVGLYVEQLLNESAPAAREAAAAGVRRALASTDALLDDMLRHLQLEAGSLEARARPVRVQDVLARLGQLHRPAAAEAGLQLRIAPSSLWVQADPDLAERALGNFVANALRHSGGERVLLGARRAGGMVRVYVVDDGFGVDEADRARLFDDYVQGSAHCPEVRGGFGLGLASARRMAALMGGEAGLDARWRGGAAFYLQLPRARPVS